MPDTAGKRENATEFCLVGVLFALNILDAIVTLLVVPSGLAEEVNLLPKVLLDAGPVLFLLVKIGGVTAALVWAWWRLRSGKWNPRIVLPILSVVTVAMIIVVAIGTLALVA